MSITAKSMRPGLDGLWKSIQEYLKLESSRAQLVRISESLCAGFGLQMVNLMTISRIVKNINGGLINALLFSMLGKI